MSFTIRCRFCQSEFEQEDLATASDTCFACAKKRKRERAKQEQLLDDPPPVEHRPGDPTKVVFVVPYAPVPQPRPRTGLIPIGPRCGVCKQLPSRAVIREADSKHPIGLWKIRVLDGWRLVLPRAGWRFEGPLVVGLRIITPRKKSERAQERTRSIVGSTLNGDVDNYAKAILDALNGKAWRDDAQISLLIVDRWVAGANEEPQAQISISQLGELIVRFTDEIFQEIARPEQLQERKALEEQGPRPKPSKGPGRARTLF